jgi:hypothetical protein
LLQVVVVEVVVDTLVEVELEACLRILTAINFSLLQTITLLLLVPVVLAEAPFLTHLMVTILRDWGLWLLVGVVVEIMDILILLR